MRSGLLIQYTAKVRIPPSGGILRRAEIYQRPAADLEIRSNITPHSKFPYKKQEDSMSSCFFFSGVERANIRHRRNSRMGIAARDTISTNYTCCAVCTFHLLACQYTASGGMHPNVSYRCTTMSGAFSFSRVWRPVCLEPTRTRKISYGYCRSGYYLCELHFLY